MSDLAGEPARLLQRLELGRKFEFDPCCDAAYDQVMDVLHRPADGEGDPGDRWMEDPDQLAEALSHGWVAAAVAVSELHLTNRDDRAGHPDLVRLGSTIVEQATRHQAAGRLLLAAEAEHRGDAVTAESLLHEALSEEPDYQPVARHLAELEIDRGDLEAAVSLMERSGAGASLQHRYVTELRQRIAEPYRHVGRNQSCPCGSGQKYKLCCLGRPKVLPGVRHAPVDLKLLLFAHSSRCKDRLAEVAAAACDPDDPDPAGFTDHVQAIEKMIHHPLMADLLAFEGGCAGEYLTERGELLPDEERRLLGAALDEPRRLWDVLEGGPGRSLRLRDPETDRTVDLDVPAASRQEPAGTAVMWRIVHVDGHDHPLGVRVKVEPDEQEPLRKLLASEPSALDLARWFREHNRGPSEPGDPDEPEDPASE